jgi:hypothetical protein
MAQKVSVKLFDMVFRNGNVSPCMEDGFHDFSIAGDFLLVAAVEALDFQVGQQALNLAVGQLAALNAGGRSDAFDGGNMAQRPQPIRRKGTKRAPGALELINLSNQSQQFRRDLYGIGFDHTRLYTRLYRIIHPNNYPIAPD